jgi:hypothetical protein
MIRPTTGRAYVRSLAACAALACLALTGCVDRRFIISSDPPGALVLVNGKPIGITPVDKQFTYYGKYRLTIIKDGYETLVVDQPVPTPWYEYFPLEFISENLVPWPIRDERPFHYKLEPLQVVPPEAVLSRAEQLRVKGQLVGVPGPGQPVPVPPGVVPVPVEGAPPGDVPVPVPPGQLPPQVQPVPPGAAPGPAAPAPGPTFLPPRGQ